MSDDIPIPGGEDGEDRIRLSPAVLPLLGPTMSSASGYSTAASLQAGRALRTAWDISAAVRTETRRQSVKSIARPQNGSLRWLAAERC
ncbi:MULTISPECIES: hypothetical protein [Streptomyces]|uniref:Uncharacterized protein n=2 Tax=Streptomyces rimosus TaxID=1927 RepID=L8F3V7_STRR1|nr:MULTISPECIES: hypothetical protein [Streptomyces]KOG73085.1 hypothetical protein ADK78_17660 [Kitasatospora aureofaciens]MYT42062.1 hypothetical protein [Streptomyces sp. SID5471]KEF04854.1 hypothetical protein DF17_21660 [Streptomyces rimosus]KEF10910.1 hypothetical protein DF18_36415 [Streptomyces rimosus]KOT38633.1 hypothetical protein ADK42_16940 [Streptomyces rimosus subsp. rimosus]